jgi:hypothetical protein
MDAGTWARARGWALWKALITLAGPDAEPGAAAAAARVSGGSSRIIGNGPGEGPAV